MYDVQQAIAFKKAKVRLAMICGTLAFLAIAACHYLGVLYPVSIFAYIYNLLSRRLVDNVDDPQALDSHLQHPDMTHVIANGLDWLLYAASLSLQLMSLTLIFGVLVACLYVGAIVSETRLNPYVVRSRWELKKKQVTEELAKKLDEEGLQHPRSLSQPKSRTQGLCILF